MARKLDIAQQAELAAFVNALAAAAGYETAVADWARESGYPQPNLSNLRNGKGAVDGYNLLRLIRSAARRAGVEPEKMAMAVVQAQSAAVESQSIGRRLDALAELVGEALDLLHEQGQHHAEAAPQQPPDEQTPAKEN